MSRKEMMLRTWDVLEEFGSGLNAVDRDGFAGYRFNPEFGNIAPERFGHVLELELEKTLDVEDVHIDMKADQFGSWFVGVMPAPQAQDLAF